MGTELHNLKPPEGARKKKKRVGRGIGSGRGKTSTRGMKGQLYRRTSMPASFEGGQLPLHMRIPKLGFVNIHRIPQHGLNISVLEEKFEAGADVTPEILHERGLVPKNAAVIKLLAKGALSKKLNITVHKASEAAKAAVAKAGGSVTVLVQPKEIKGKKAKRIAAAIAAKAARASAE